MGFPETFTRDGFVLVRDAIPQEQLDGIEAHILDLIRKWTGQSLMTTRSSEFADLLLADRDLEKRLYEEVRSFDWLTDFSLTAGICEPVASLLGAPVGLMGKIPLRIDLPMVTRELAVWHQDYFYVKGNTDVVTAWIPLQDTEYVHGCLMVMPGSHQLGFLDHDVGVLGKRHFPSNIFHRDVRYVEMKRGDVLLFHSLLLHSSGFNISSFTRLSVQARYTRLDAKTDPSMGQVVPAPLGTA